MMMISHFTINRLSIWLLMTCLSVVSRSLADSVDQEACLKAGFKKVDLSCDSCNALSRFDLDDLKETCLSCCTQSTQQATSKKYSSARLEICACNLGHYPQVQAFVKSDRPKSFPRLTVKHVPGRHPTIVLKDADGEEIEEMSIRKWDTDTIEEFLREHLS